MKFLTNPVTMVTVGSYFSFIWNWNPASNEWKIAADSRATGGSALLHHIWSGECPVAVGDCGFEPHSGLQVCEETPLTREESILWGTLVTDRSRPQTARARISNGGQCHLIHLTFLRRLFWTSLAYTSMCTKVTGRLIYFISFSTHHGVLWINNALSYSTA